MPGAVSGLFQTVVAAANEACQVLTPTHALLNAIYWDHQGAEPGVLYNVINVPLPSDPAALVSDVGAGDMQVNEVTSGTVPITLSHHPQYAYVIRDFDQYRTPLRLRTLFLDGAIKGIKTDINAKACNLFTSANFPTNGVVSCAGSITMTQFTAAMATLSDQYVNIEDRENMSCVLPSVPYTQLLDPTTGTVGAAWTQAFIAGTKAIEETREGGKIPTAYNTRFWRDQQMPTSGVSGGATTVYTGAYLHRWAVSGVTRPIPTDPIAEKSCDIMYIKWDNISIRIVVSYSHVPYNGPVISVEAAYGLAVTRENMAQLFTIAA
jgi:hypothetical protein